MLFLQEEFDTHDPKAHHFFKLSFLKKWFQIVEFGVARDIVFVFNQGARLIPTCFITYLMGHIVVGCFNDLQVGFECIEHNQKNVLSTLI
jgi:hypothetical protein